MALGRGLEHTGGKRATEALRTGIGALIVVCTWIAAMQCTGGTPDIETSCPVFPACLIVLVGGMRLVPKAPSLCCRLRPFPFTAAILDRPSANARSIKFLEACLPIHRRGKKGQPLKVRGARQRGIRSVLTRTSIVLYSGARLTFDEGAWSIWQTMWRERIYMVELLCSWCEQWPETSCSSFGNLPGSGPTLGFSQEQTR